MTAAITSTNGLSLLDDIYDRIRAGNLSHAMSRFCAELPTLRQGMSQEQWQEFCRRTLPGHPMGEVLRQIPLQDRWLEAPFQNADCSPVLFAWEHGLALSAAMRSRAEVFRQEIDEIRREMAGARVLSVNHSHYLQEIFSPFPQDQAADVDFVYAINAFDALKNAEAARFLGRLFALLAPNGRLFIASLTPDIPDAAYLEACLHWWPEYRSEEDMVRLTQEIPDQQISSQCIFRDSTGYNVFLELQKSPAMELPFE